MDIQLISTISILLPAIVGVVFFKSLWRPCKILFYFVCITVLLETVGRIMWHYGMNNLFLFHIYSFVEFGAISLIYYLITANKNQKRFIVIFLFVFQGFSVINLMFEDLSGFNSFQRQIEALIVLYYLISFLFETSKNDRYNLNNPYLILTFGYVIYFVGTLYLFMYGKRLTEAYGSYWLIHSSINIFLNIVYSIVFFIKPRES